MNRFARSTLAVALAFAAGGIASADDFTLRVIALSDQDAPGFPGLTLGFVDLGHINEAGDIVFTADLEGEGVDETNESVVYIVVDDGTSVPQYREGDPIFQGADATFASLPDPAINQNGLLALNAGVIDPNFSSPVFEEQPTIAGVFSEPSAGLIGPVALEFDPAVGLDDNFGALSQAPFNAAGHVAFTGSNQFEDSFGGDVSALWTDRSGSLELLLQTGDALPGAPEGSVIGVIDRPAINASDTIVFRVSLVDENDTDVILAHGIYAAENAAAVTPIALTGDPAPNVPGATFERLSQTPLIGEDGGVFFFATITGGGIDATNDGGYWVASQPGAEPEALVREGQQVLDLGADVVIERLSEQAAWTDAGSSPGIPFNAFVVGDGVDETNNGVLLFADEQGLISVVAREGDQAPGLPDGVTFASFEHPARELTGAVAFVAMLGGTVEVGDNRALFAGSNQQGEQGLVARTGDLIDLAGDGSDVREIRDISFNDRGVDAGRGSLALESVVFKLWFEGNEHALLAAAPRCPADINGDGEADIFDFVAFQVAFFAEDPIADCNDDGEFDVFDFPCFQEVFQQGCP